MATEVLNAKITKTQLGYEPDRGFLTCGFCIDGDGWGTWVGTSYCLDAPMLGALVTQMLKTVGVDSWEQMKGQYIRAESHGIGSSTTKFGHLLKDEWLDLEAFMEPYRAVKGKAANKW